MTAPILEQIGKDAKRSVLNTERDHLRTEAGDHDENDNFIYDWENSTEKKRKKSVKAWINDSPSDSEY